MIETIFVFCLASILGILTGLLPGFGVMAIMLVSFPYLLFLEPHNVILFYVIVCSIDQFFSGITAIVFGVPGSSHAVPSSYEGHKLFKEGRGSEAIMYSAISSWLLSLFAVVLILCLLPFLFILYKTWNSHVQMIVFSLATFFILLTSRNGSILNILLFCLGNLIGWVGYSDFTNSSFLTFDLSLLYGGFPTMVVVTSLFVVPLIINSYLTQSKTIDFPGVSLDGYKSSFKDILKNYKATLVRSGLLGSLGGFVPGFSYGMSSIIAYSVEKIYQKRKNAYSQGNINCLIASEGANNAGVFTQLIPLLFLGIPITVGEAVVYNVIESRGYPVTIEWFQSTFTLVIALFLLSSTFGLFAAGKYVNFLKVLDGFSIIWLYIFVIVFLFSSIFYLGNMQLAGWDHLLLTFFLLPIGILCYKLDMLPLVFGFILHDYLYEVGYRILLMHF